jgi:hypothetical protein
MPQQVRWTKEGSIDFETNSVVAKSISRGMVYRELALKLVGAATISSTNNTQAKTLKGDEWACVKKIEIIANNTDVVFSMSGNALWWLNFFTFGAAPQITSNLGDAATANPPFTSVLIIPFWSPRSIRPIDTALDSRNLSDLKVQVTWGTYTDINGDASGWTTEPTLYLSALQSFNVKGPFSGKRIYTIEKAIPADSNHFQVQLPVGPMYRGFMINTEDDGKDSATVLDNFKVVSGSTVFADMYEDLLEQHCRLRMGIDRTHDSGAAVDYFELRRGSTYNLNAGWYYFDHVTDGYISEAIDTLGFSEFELELEVNVGQTEPTKIFIYPIQIHPIRGKK